MSKLTRKELDLLTECGFFINDTSDCDLYKLSCKGKRKIKIKTKELTDINDKAFTAFVVSLDMKDSVESYYGDTLANAILDAALNLYADYVVTMEYKRNGRVSGFDNELIEISYNHYVELKWLCSKLMAKGLK